MIKKVVIKNLFAYEGTTSLEFGKQNFLYGINGQGKTSFINSLKFAFKDMNMPIEQIVNNKAEEGSIYIEMSNFSIYKKINKVTSETFISVIVNEERIDGFEAVDFLDKKFPNHIVDILFYDGEADRNLLTMSKYHQEKFFSKILDLDILFDMKKDLILSKKKILDSIKKEDSNNFFINEQKISKLQISVNSDVEKKKKMQNKIYTEKKNIFLLKEKIYTFVEKLENLENEKEILKNKYNIETDKLKKFFIMEMPFFISDKYNSILNKTNKSIEIINKQNFINILFENGLDNEKIDSILHSVNNCSIDTLSMNTTEVKNIFIQIAKIKNQLITISEKIKETKKITEENEKIKELFISLQEKEEKFKESIKNLDMLLLKIKSEIEEKTLLQNENSSFYNSNKNIKKANHSINLINSLLDEVEERTMTVKNEKINLINIELKKYTKSFIFLYPNIKTIFLSSQLSIVVLDTNNKKLDLLSAGQKQVLNFLILKCIVDNFGFSDFIVVDTPFGRLSKNNRKIIFEDCYLGFTQTTLLLTDTEKDGIKDLYSIDSIKEKYPKINEFFINNGKINLNGEEND